MDRAAREERRRPQMRPYLLLKVARRNAARASATTVAKWDIGQRNVTPRRRTRTRAPAHRPCRHQAPSQRISQLDLPTPLLSMISKGMASGWSRKLPSTLHHLQLLSRTHCWAHWTIPRLRCTGRGRKPCWRRNLLGPLSPPLYEKHNELDSAKDNRSYGRWFGAIAGAGVERGVCEA